MPIHKVFHDMVRAKPIIYAYTEPNNSELRGLIKIGYTTRSLDERMREHYPTLKPGKAPYRVVFSESAIRADGTSFTDHDVHANLRKNGFHRLRDAYGKNTEWFRCTVDNVRAAWIAVRNRTENKERRTQEFKMRPEQATAVKVTREYYERIDALQEGRAPRFLWNAKMRFGKTFATYELAKSMGARKVLVLTFKPAVESAWREDLLTHVDFEGWKFVDKSNAELFDPDTKHPFVCFGSFQDFLGRDRRTGGIKARNEWVHLTDWDLVVFDEYHFGAWNDNAKGLFEADDEDEIYSYATGENVSQANSGNGINENDLPIHTSHYLFLSGTPFKALSSGEFIEEQIYNWTYTDEQSHKEAWPETHPGESNPYEALPRMMILTYKVPDEIASVARRGEFDSFDLNAFFEAKGEEDSAEFVMKDSVQKWLDLIRGAHLPSSIDDMKLGSERPPMPFSDARLLSVLNHTVWFLPNVSSCYAMRNLLKERQNTFFHDYTINVCAGMKAGIGLEAYYRVQETMQDPLESKTITLTCGKLMTGVTVRPWTGIFMLRNLSSPETYFQAAFRVQSPWVVDGDDGEKVIVKPQCYVFDFALNRSLKMIADYSNSLDPRSTASPEEKVGEFINFLPVLAFDGSSMYQVSAEDILDIALAGTSATLLARRWESALLVNVDNETLRRILANERAMEALMSIEGFRALGSDIIETIVNKSEAVKKARRENESLTSKQKKELSAEEKEFKSKRKQVQEKLMKFATRIPLFMYLTDYREYCLQDVITQLEPGLFKKVTGLTVEDFELLVSLDVFNASLMNDAIWKFRRYEEASLTYTGINKHAGERRGLFNTTLSEYEFYEAAQQESMDLPMRESVSADSQDAAEHTNKLTQRTNRVTTDVGKSVQKTSSVKTSASKGVGSKHLMRKETQLKHTSRLAKPATSSTSPRTLPRIENESEPSPRSAFLKGPCGDIVSKGINPGTKVRHRTYGEGVVESVNKETGFITVQLDDKSRKFQYPEAFQRGFLQLL